MKLIGLEIEKRTDKYLFFTIKIKQLFKVKEYDCYKDNHGDLRLSDTGERIFMKFNFDILSAVIAKIEKYDR